jgi:sarcosine oxidase subunit gamma
MTPRGSGSVAEAMSRLSEKQSSLRELEGPGFRLQPEHLFGIVKVQFYRKEDASFLSRALGESLPAAGRQVPLADGAECAWLAPGEWLLIGPEPVIADLARRLDGELMDVLSLITDLTHSQFPFLLTGPCAKDRLATLCPLDLRDEAFPVGAAARSLLGEARLFVARNAELDGEPAYRLLVDQTLAAYAARMIALP